MAKQIQPTNGKDRITLFAVIRIIIRFIPLIITILKLINTQQQNKQAGRKKVKSKRRK